MTFALIFNPISLFLIYILYAYLYPHQNVNVIAKIAYWLVTMIGAVIDMVVNVVWATVVFWDWPHEWLLTQRIERLKSKSGYRGKLANKLCDLLNYILPGHCR